MTSNVDIRIPGSGRPKGPKEKKWKRGGKGGGRGRKKDSHAGTCSCVTFVTSLQAPWCLPSSFLRFFFKEPLFLAHVTSPLFCFRHPDTETVCDILVFLLIDWNQFEQHPSYGFCIILLSKFRIYIFIIYIWFHLFISLTMCQKNVNV